jgi:hypothetical protein
MPCLSCLRGEFHHRGVTQDAKLATGGSQHSLPTTVASDGHHSLVLGKIYFFQRTGCKTAGSAIFGRFSWSMPAQRTVAAFARVKTIPAAVATFSLLRTSTNRMVQSCTYDVVETEIAVFADLYAKATAVRPNRRRPRRLIASRRTHACGEYNTYSPTADPLPPRYAFEPEGLLSARASMSTMSLSFVNPSSVKMPAARSSSSALKNKMTLIARAASLAAL